MTENAEINAWLRGKRRSANAPLPDNSGAINAAIREAAGRAPADEQPEPDEAA